MRGSRGRYRQVFRQCNAFAPVFLPFAEANAHECALLRDEEGGLLLAIGDRMRALTTVIELLIPYDRGDIVATVHREGEVVSTSNEESGMRLRARLADASAGRLSQFVVAK